MRACLPIRNRPAGKPKFRTYLKSAIEICSHEMEQFVTKGDKQRVLQRRSFLGSLKKQIQMPGSSRAVAWTPQTDRPRFNA